MAKVTFRQHNAPDRVVVAEAGDNVMRIAVLNDVPGIVGECGGQAMCATCHVYVCEPFSSVFEPIDEDEDEMLDCTASPRDVLRSRLGCQLFITEDVEEVEVDVPSAQV